MHGGKYKIYYFFVGTAENKNMEENYDLNAEFRVRLPQELADKIAEVAKKERRSRNLQYVFMLENWFEINESLEKRIKNLEKKLTSNEAGGKTSKKKAV